MSEIKKLKNESNSLKAQFSKNEEWKLNLYKFQKNKIIQNKLQDKKLSLFCTDVSMNKMCKSKGQVKEQQLFVQKTKLMLYKQTFIWFEKQIKSNKKLLKQSWKCIISNESLFQLAKSLKRFMKDCLELINNW